MANAGAWRTLWISHAQPGQSNHYPGLQWLKVFTVLVGPIFLICSNEDVAAGIPLATDLGLISYKEFLSAGVVAMTPL